MYELVITPRGHLAVRQLTDESTAITPSTELIAAFQQGTAQGLLLAAGDDSGTSLPASFAFARSFSRAYFSAICRVSVNHSDGELPELSPPLADLENTVLQAPPMTGLEYLSTEVLATWWRQLDMLVRAKIADHPGGVQDYLRQHNPQWRYIGRVTFHLAENKRNADFPFAFLATFSDGLTPEGNIRHEPLANALRKYAGVRNREAMLTLLLPVSRASESLEWVHKLVNSGEIYHPLAWSPRQAHAFLKSIHDLESSGLIVRVPDWWNARKPTRPQVSVKIDTEKKSNVGVDAILNFSISVSLNGETLNKAEIGQLLEAAGGLVPLKGKWVEVDSAKLEQVLKHWEEVEKGVRSQGISFYEGMRLLAGVQDGIEHTGKSASEASQAEIREWTGLAIGPELEQTLTRMRSPEFYQDTAPPGLRARLRPYQITGYSWLRFIARLGLGGCLADDMGLGKTLQVIALLLDFKTDREHRASLLVVPASLVANWKAELARFAPGLTYAVVHPSESPGDRDPINDATADRMDLVITSYGMLVRSEWMHRHSWRAAILDEAQAIKNSGTKQAGAVRKLRAGTRIAMTGTPIENRLSDLWSLFAFLNPGLLGNAKEFARFVKQMQDASEPSFEPLRRLVGPYILRRLKTDKKVISDLPDKVETNAYCLLSKTQAAMYQKTVDDLARALDSGEPGIQRRGIVLAQLMRLKQICNHPAQVSGSNSFTPDQSGKFQRLAEIAEQIASRQEKLLVFTQFREMTEPLEAFLATIFGRHGLVLHGGTAVKKRQELVDQFQNDDGPPFFILSIKAGGTGLNLTAAAHVVHFDRWWNPAIENQATDRAFRIGQKQNVLVHKFVCRGTVEERIDTMILEKSRMTADVIGTENSGEGLLTEMDNATLMKLVALDLHQATEA